MTRDKDFMWLLRLIYWGILGILLCWLPVVIAACRVLRGDSPLDKALEWEWHSYTSAIEDAIR